MEKEKNEQIEIEDIEGFDGRYVQGFREDPCPPYNYDLLGKYMRKNNKKFKDLTPEEVLQFML